MSKIIEQQLARPGIHLVDTSQYFCREDECPGVDENGLPIYKDTHHLRSSFLEHNADFLFDLLELEAPDAGMTDAED